MTTRDIHIFFTDPAAARACQYLRVSQDKKKRARSVDQQDDANVSATAAHGLTISGTYKDNDRSASAYATKTREDFERLVTDLDTAMWDALALWETSRGSRDVDEWIDLIKICQRRDVLIYVTSEDRFYDVRRNRRDRSALIKAASKGEDDSIETSIRIKRDVAAAAKEGRPHGQTPYGYERVYDAVTRELIEQRPKPDEAAVVKRIFTELARGEALNAVTRALNNDGIRPRRAEKWVAPLVRRIALSETYRGKREHREITYDGKRAAQGQITDAIWPELVDDATFYSVRRILTDPRRRATFKPGKAQHLLSMIALCAECGAPMHVRRYEKTGGKAERYLCRGNGCASINKRLLDDYITDEVFARLEDRWEAFTSGDDHATDAKLLAARDEVAALQARLDEHYDEAAAGRLSAKALARIEPQIEAEIAVARKRERQAATPPILRWVLDGPREDLRERWESAPAAARREVVKELFSEIKVYRRPPGGAYLAPAEERVAVYYR